MNLQRKSPGDAPGYYPIAERGTDLKYLSFAVLKLGGGLNEFSFETGEEEKSIDTYSGPVALEVESDSGSWSCELEGRESIAIAAPMVYLPPNARVRVRMLDGEAHLSIAGALGKSGSAPRKIDRSEVVARQVGKDNWTRTVFTHIADNVDAAHLISGETLNRPGGWSSCPPHKHDEFRQPNEVPMEEVYYFLLEPRQGFGFMRIYTREGDPEPFDLAFAVEHGDTLLIPRGYHPVAACPGYTLNYTWILAGEGRTYGAWADDPKHSWIKES
jgi:5-deoxy-glucuronate isomerase